MFGEDLIRIFEIDETQARADLVAHSQSNQFGRVITEWIVSGKTRWAEIGFILAGLVDLSRRVDEMCVDRDRCSGVAVENRGDELRETVWSLDEDRGRAQLPDQTRDVPGAGRTVMTDRKVDAI